LTCDFWAENAKKKLWRRQLHWNQLLTWIAFQFGCATGYPETTGADSTLPYCRQYVRFAVNERIALYASIEICLIESGYSAARYKRAAQLLAAIAS